MRAAILVAGCFLVVSSTFAAEPQLNTSTAKMAPVVVALATMPTHKVAVREATKAVATETPMAEGSLEKFGATGLPQ